MRGLSRVCLVGLVAASVFVVAGCGRKRAAITMAGSTAFQPFAEKLGEEFMAAHDDVAITVQGGGSAVGVQSALSGTAQIGMADLVTLPPEAKALTAVVVARDGIAVVVNPANKVDALSMEQVRGVFSGSIRNWREVGGEDRAITVVSRESGSGTRTSFEQIVGGIALSKSAVVQDSNGTIRETVAKDRDAVGYLSHGLLSEKIKAVQVDGRQCTTEEVMADRYALVRPVFLLTRGTPVGPVKDVLDYILSAQGQQIIKDCGLIPAK